MVSLKPLAKTIDRHPENEHGSYHINVGEVERLLSVALGIPLTLGGLATGIRNGLIPTFLGSCLIFRGVTGHSFLYQVLDVSTVHHSDALIELPDHHGIKVRRAVTTEASPEELYRFWRDFRHLPQLLNDLSVQQINNGNVHWEVKTPLGLIAWDTEITQDQPAHRISFHKTQGSFIAPSNMTVHFEPKRQGSEHIVYLELEFRQIRGPIGMVLGQIVEQVVRQCLERCRELVEAGEIATTAGQPSGRKVLSGYKEAS